MLGSSPREGQRDWRSVLSCLDRNGGICRRMNVAGKWKYYKGEGDLLLLILYSWIKSLKDAA